MNIPKVEIPEALANDIRCVKCNLYLSITPIYLKDDLGYICGRCEVPEGSIEVKMFDVVAKMLLFRCRYDSSGCSSYLTTEAIEKHEKNCEYAPVICPDIHCTAEVAPKHIKDHLITNHTIIKGDYKLLEHEFTNFIFTINSNVFILQSEMCSKSWLFSLNYLEKNLSTNSFTYKICIRSADAGSNKTFSGEYWSKQYFDKFPDSNNLNLINLKDLKNSLGSDNLIYNIVIETGSTKSYFVSDEIMKQFECPVCFNTMENEIYQCTTGHSLCVTCKKKMEACPTCRSAWSSGRNFTLEKLIEVTIEKRCPHDFCNFTGKSSDINKHLEDCKYKNINCPLSETGCKYVANLPNLVIHIENKHKDYVRQDNQILMGTYNQHGTWKRFIIFNNTLFQVNIKYDFDRVLNSSAQGDVNSFISYSVHELTDNADSFKPSYFYTIQFIDYSNKGYKLTFSNECQPLPKDGDYFKNACRIPRKMIIPFVEPDGNFRRIISIKKINCM